MGDLNQFHFVQRHASAVAGKVLEIGSKDYGNTPDYRALFTAQGYVGTDMEAGKGVDLVLDLTEDFEAIDRGLDGQRFGAVICNSVLEHCRDPFRMAGNVSRLVNRGGLLFLSAPHAWRIHGYPMDYWRFTPDGLKILFPDFDFFEGHLATGHEGELVPIDTDMFRIELVLDKGLRKRLYSRLTASAITMLRRLGRVFPKSYLLGVFQQPYLLRPVNILMVGRRK